MHSQFPLADPLDLLANVIKQSPVFSFLLLPQTKNSARNTQSHTFQRLRGSLNTPWLFSFEFWQMGRTCVDKWCFSYGESMTHGDRIVANCRQRNAVDTSCPYFSPEGLREEERGREKKCLKDLNLISQCNKVGLFHNMHTFFFSLLPSSQSFRNRREKPSWSLSWKKNPSFRLYLKFEKQGAKD